MWCESDCRTSKALAWIPGVLWNSNFSDFSDLSLRYAKEGDKEGILRWIARSKPDSERVRTGADDYLALNNWYSRDDFVTLQIDFAY